MDYWRVLVRRRSVVSTIAVTVLVLVALLTFLSTPRYRATATLQIERTGPDILTYKDVVDGDAGLADTLDGGSHESVFQFLSS